MSSPSVADRIRSARVALLVNVALVMTGSILALLAVIDVVTGMIVVAIGFAGVVASLLGQRAEGEARVD